MTSRKQGMMFVMSSPSGAGKTTLTKMLSKNSESFVISISHTTRKPREKEVDGVDYFFVDKSDFESLIKEKKFFEYAKIFGNLYGTLKDPVIKNLENGKNVLFDIDWQGSQQLREQILNQKLVTFFILPPDIETLRKRLENRDQDGKQIVDERMRQFKTEISHWEEYDYVVINKNLDKCYKNILEIISSEQIGKKFNYNRNEIKETVLNLIK